MFWYQEEEESELVEYEPEEESEWEPDGRAVNDPADFRINIWHETVLGKPQH